MTVTDALPDRDATPLTQRRWITPAAIAVALLPFVASAISMASAVGSSFHPVADQAWIELQIRDIGHLPVLLGPYSRFEWFHPGPLLYYVLWLPYRLTGSSAVSLVIGALTVNAAAITGIALIARRRGGTALMLVTLTLLALLERTLGAQFLRDVWNPSITVLPLVLLAFLAWTLSMGDAWALPVAAVVATFLVQTHVSYGLLALTIVGVGIVGAVATEWRRRPASAPRRRSWWIGGGVTVAALALLWLPVAVQQLFRDPGNAGQLYRFFTHHGAEQSWADAFHAMATQLSLWPEWLRGAGHPDRSTGALDLTGAMPIPAGLVALAGAAGLAWRKDRAACRLDLIVLAAVLAGVVAVTRIVGEIFPYLVRWSWALGMLTWLALAWTAAAVWRAGGHASRRPRVGQATMAALVAALCVLTVVNVVDAGGAGNPDPAGSRTVARFTDAILDQLPTGAGVVELRTGGTGATWIGGGIADELEKRGVTTRVEPALGFAYGYDRVLDGEQVRQTVLPMEDADIERDGVPGGFTEISRSGGLHLFVSDH